MKKRLIILSILISFISAAMAQDVFAAIPKATDVFFVNDFAGVLSDSTITYIVDENKRIQSVSGAQIVVTTVDFTDGTDISSYSLKMLREYGVGDKNKNNGILLLLAIGEDDYYAQIGSGLEGYISGGDMENLLFEYLEPDFAKGSYDAGVRAAFGALVGKINRIYGASGAVGQASQTSGGVSSMGADGLIRVIFVIAIIVIILKLFRPRRRRGYRRGGMGMGIAGFLGGFLLGRGGRRGPAPHHRHGPGFGGGMFGGSGPGVGRSFGSRPSGGFGGGGFSGGNRGGGGSGRGAGAGRRR